MQPNPAQSSDVPGRNEASPRSEQSRNPLSSGLAIVAFLAGIAIAGFDIRLVQMHSNGHRHRSRLAAISACFRRGFMPPVCSQASRQGRWVHRTDTVHNAHRIELKGES